MNKTFALIRSLALLIVSMVAIFLRYYMRARRPCARRILGTGVHTRALLPREPEVHSSSVSVVYVLRSCIVFSKAALKKRVSMEPTEPPLGPPL